MNICVFGDSIAKGVVYDEIKDKYVFLKDSFINLTQADTGIMMKNYAKFGSTTAKGIETIKKHEEHISECDYTILEFGGNDCDLLWNEIAETPEEEHLPLVTMEQFRQFYTVMLSKVRASGSRPVMLTLPPLVSERFFKWVSRGLASESILDFLGGDTEYIYRWHEQYNSMVYEIANEQNVPVIDIRSAVLAQPDYKSLVCIDGMHPNCEGHKVIAEYFKNAICELVSPSSTIEKTA